MQAPANAALKTLARAMPDVLRIFLARLGSAERFEREHAAKMLADIAASEPELLNPKELRKEITRLAEVGDKNALRQIKKIMLTLRGVSRKKRYKYGL